ncbi:hypothetical protein SADUNF_Sadunf14G0085900 [Salix dunnii]|uniref:Uncharacterized protein n=1 Tax=Salix dunnii TaxID=1413687 RepID=A0A835JDK1_9ROSI|nr:hypothetical protein SADUNF_Sadunf14G0085900 [Salix dunnii]
MAGSWGLAKQNYISRGPLSKAFYFVSVAYVKLDAYKETTISFWSISINGSFCVVNSIPLQPARLRVNETNTMVLNFFDELCGSMGSSIRDEVILDGMHVHIHNGAKREISKWFQKLSVLCRKRYQHETLLDILQQCNLHRGINKSMSQNFECGERGSNTRPSDLQSDALPTELSPPFDTFPVI